MIRKNKIFTIGHSTHPIDIFLQILQKNHIDVIIDVRSTPYSRFANQYNKDNLNLFLKTSGIFYIPMGDLLGARYDDNSLLFDDGKVNFKKVASTNKFHNGIKRINDGLSKGYTIVLMCSEKNPLECHRFSLISHFLDEHGYDVNHILPDRLIPHKLLDRKLFDYFESKRKLTFEIDKILNLNSTQYDLFNTINKNDVYIALNKLVAFNPYSQTEHAE